MTHIVGSKALRMPLAEMGKEMLLATTVTETTDNTVAHKRLRGQRRPCTFRSRWATAWFYMHRINPA